MWHRLATLDRRWIFLFVALAVVGPLCFPLKLPVQPSGPATNLYRAVDALPRGSLVCLSFDFGPATAVECLPMGTAILRHAFGKGLRVVGMCIWAEGPPFARQALESAAREAAKTYGVDYVNLGYKAGGEVLLRSVGDDFRREFRTDRRGTRLAELPIMRDVAGWDSFDLVITLSAARPGINDYVRVVGTQYARPLGGGVTAVMAPEVYPFLNSGQLLGLLGGLRGAAEYEALLGRPGTATPAMDAQSIVHFLIAGFIVFANVAWFMDRRRRRRR